MNKFIRRLIGAYLIRTHWFYSERFLIKTIYWCSFNKTMNLNNPLSFNEKLRWMMLNYRNPLYSILVNKYTVKEWVASKIGIHHIIPTLGIWDSFDSINFNELPNQFVLKTTHGGGGHGIVICQDKMSFDKKKAKKILQKSMKDSVYQGEWPYLKVPRKIIAEKYMSDPNSKDLKDYKFFCFNGEVKALFVASERGIADEPNFDFFDAEFNHLPIKQGHPNAPFQIEKPKNFEMMKDIASILSKDFPHVRIDLYDIDGKIYFGEMTFFHFGGRVPFVPESWDYTFGEWLNLPNKNN